MVPKNSIDLGILLVDRAEVASVDELLSLEWEEALKKAASLKDNTTAWTIIGNWAESYYFDILEESIGLKADEDPTKKQRTLTNERTDQLMKKCYEPRARQTKTKFNKMWILLGLFRHLT